MAGWLGVATTGEFLLRTVIMRTAIIDPAEPAHRALCYFRADQRGGGASLWRSGRPRTSHIVVLTDCLQASSFSSHNG
jgi:hypothetical protein